MRIVAVCLLSLALSAGGQVKPERAKPRQTTLTGCVDQRGEMYVLTEDSAMKAQAILKGRAFSDDNFARFVGTKATATGELEEAEGKRLLHVVKIEKVADTCH